MKNKKILVLSAFSALLLVATLIGCTGTGGLLFPGGGLTLHTPKFLVALDETGNANNLNVFSVDPSTGVLTAVSGSPFATGLGDGYGAGVIVHPNHGDWVYVADDSGNVQALVIGSNGTPSVKSTGSSGSCCFGWVNNGLAISADGRFLYTTTDDTDIVIWSIDQTTGALTNIGNYTTPTIECSYGVAVSGNFLYTNDDCNYTVQVATIGANGMLTDLQTVTVPDTGSYLWTLAVDKSGKYLYVGDESATLTRYTIGTDGKLTFAGTTTQNAGDGDMDSISFTADNKFLVTTTDRTGTAVFSINQSSGDLTQVAGSPFGTEDSYGTVLVDPSSKFVYVSDDCSDIVAYKIDPNTGALTAVTNSPFNTANGCAYGFAVTW